jgi:hypothetical protein
VSLVVGILRLRIWAGKHHGKRYLLESSKVVKETRRGLAGDQSNESFFAGLSIAPRGSILDECAAVIEREPLSCSRRARNYGRSFPNTFGERMACNLFEIRNLSARSAV